MTKTLTLFLCTVLLLEAAPLSAYEAAVKILEAKAGPDAAAPRPASILPSGTQELSLPAPELMPPTFSEAPVLSAAPVAAAEGEITPEGPARGEAAGEPAMREAPAGSVASRVKRLLGSFKRSWKPSPEPEPASFPDAGLQVAKHDGHRFEIKLDVHPAAGRAHVYRIGTYFFVPHSLGINPSTFPKEAFYRHIQSRIRFKTPKMPISAILDEKNAASPLQRIASTLKEMREQRGLDALNGRAYTEVRLLGKISAVALRDQAAALETDLAQSAKTDKTKLPAIGERLAAYLDDAARLAGRVRALRAGLPQTPVAAQAGDTVKFLDEYVSLSIVEHLIPLLSAIRADSALNASLAREDERIAGMIKSEDAYRAAAGYPSVADKATASEALFYRRAVLSSFFSSVLDLDAKTSDWSGAFQVLFGVSAAVAMFVYLAVWTYFQQRATPDTLIVIGMLGYVVKDRLKDGLRDWSVSRWRKRFSDAVTAIRDPASGSVVGRVKESVSFVSHDEVPAEVLRIRQADPLAAVGEDGKPENILHYEKEVKLDPGMLDQTRARGRDLDDFMLVNLFPFLENTDDAQVGFTYLDPQSGKLESLPGARVYHVNMVTRYEVGEPAGGKKPVYDRLRVIVNRDGIQRIEKVKE